MCGSARGARAPRAPPLPLVALLLLLALLAPANAALRIAQTASAQALQAQAGAWLASALDSSKTGNLTFVPLPECGAGAGSSVQAAGRIFSSADCGAGGETIPAVHLACHTDPYSGSTKNPYAIHPFVSPETLAHVMVEIVKMLKPSLVNIFDLGVSRDKDSSAEFSSKYVDRIATVLAAELASLAESDAKIDHIEVVHRAGFEDAVDRLRDESKDKKTVNLIVGADDGFLRSRFFDILDSKKWDISKEDTAWVMLVDWLSIDFADFVKSKLTGKQETYAVRVESSSLLGSNDEELKEYLAKNSLPISALTTYARCVGVYGSLFDRLAASYSSAQLEQQKFITDGSFAIHSNYSILAGSFKGSSFSIGTDSYLKAGCGIYEITTDGLAQVGEYSSSGAMSWTRAPDFLTSKTPSNGISPDILIPVIISLAVLFVAITSLAVYLHFKNRRARRLLKSKSSKGSFQTGLVMEDYPLKDVLLIVEKLKKAKQTGFRKLSDVTDEDIQKLSTFLMSYPTSSAYHPNLEATLRMNPNLDEGTKRWILDNILSTDTADNYAVAHQQPGPSSSPKATSINLTFDDFNDEPAANGSAPGAGAANRPAPIFAQLLNKIRKADDGKATNSPVPRKSILRTFRGESTDSVYQVAKTGSTDQIGNNNRHVAIEVEKSVAVESHYTLPDAASPDGNGAVSPRFSRSVETDFKTTELSPETRRLMIQAIDKWDFDIFEFHKAVNGHSLFHLGLFVLERHDLIAPFNIPIVKLKNWLEAIETNYNAHPYHNSIHGADVLAASTYLLLEEKMAVYFTPLEKFALVAASLAHDIDHPAVNNNFLIKTQHKMAVLYNDQSVCEAHHASRFFQVTLRPDNNVFGQISQQQYENVRKMIVHLILATDLAKHFEFFNKFKVKASASMSPRTSLKPATSAGGLNSRGSHSSLNVLADNPKKLKGFDLDNAEDRLLILGMAIKLADLSNPAKTFEISKQWVSRILQEFFTQGDREREYGLPVSQYMDRGNCNIAKCQLGFLEFLVLPSYEAWKHMAPSNSKAAAIVATANRNRNFWASQTGNTLITIETLPELEFVDVPPPEPQQAVPIIVTQATPSATAGDPPHSRKQSYDTNSAQQQQQQRSSKFIPTLLGRAEEMIQAPPAVRAIKKTASTSSIDDFKSVMAAANESTNSFRSVESHSVVNDGRGSTASARPRLARRQSEMAKKSPGLP